jgi:hypothetical protein
MSEMAPMSEVQRVMGLSSHPGLKSGFAFVVRLIFIKVPEPDFTKECFGELNHMESHVVREL